MSGVKLQVYDLSQGMARQMSLPLLGQHIEAVYHTGVAVHGWEYFFGGGGGVERSRPGMTPYGRPIRVIDMGTTTMSERDLATFLNSIKSEFCATRYNLFNHNCNTFSNTLAQFLVNHPIPAEITNLPANFLNTPLGSMLRPMLEQIMGPITTPEPVRATQGQTMGPTSSLPSLNLSGHSTASGATVASTQLPGLKSLGTPIPGGITNMLPQSVQVQIPFTSLQGGAKSAANRLIKLAKAADNMNNSPPTSPTEQHYEDLLIIADAVDKQAVTQTTLAPYIFRSISLISATLSPKDYYAVSNFLRFVCLHPDGSDWMISTPHISTPRTSTIYLPPSVSPLDFATAFSSGIPINPALALTGSRCMLNLLSTPNGCKWASSRDILPIMTSFIAAAIRSENAEVGRCGAESAANLCIGLSNDEQADPAMEIAGAALHELSSDARIPLCPGLLCAVSALATVFDDVVGLATALEFQLKAATKSQYPELSKACMGSLGI